MMRALAVLGLLLAGCAAAPPPVSAPAAACPAGHSPGVLAEAFLGRNIGTRPGVDDAALRAFLDAEVTPRFPDGFTLADARGQFRGADGVLVREPAARLTLLLTDPAAQRPRLAELAGAYAARFRQEAVLVVETPACFVFQATPQALR
jgi:hypothetical protein